MEIEGMQIRNDIPRPEHPRPDFMRETFYNLNGEWEFSFDDEEIGLRDSWQKPEHHLDKTIVVPFCYQCAASGIGPTDEIHPVIWYRRRFMVPEEMKGRRVRVCFGAVDYEATVYVNGYAIGSHRGGYTPFALDATEYLVDGENDLCVRVVDRPDPTQPRGKQFWKRGLASCWYTPVSGIWQTVYLEAVGELSVEYIHVTPDIEHGLANIELMLNKAPDKPITLKFQVELQGKQLCDMTLSANNRLMKTALDLNTYPQDDEVVLWSPQNPALYDLRVTVLHNGQTQDHIDTYFGMRKIEVRNGTIYLNNRRIYQRLVLDQGYWPDTLLTPPSDEAIRADLQWILKLGFNGARKHQKIEDPRYYYWADKMGVLIWGELPSPFAFSDLTVENMTQTMLEFIRRDFNHPSIITWVPLNESWGVRTIATNRRQQMTASMLYYLTKSADGTRLCSGNDGWEQLQTDICALHDYNADPQVLKAHFANRKLVESTGNDEHRSYVDGYAPTGKEAVMATEYGGIAFSNIGIQGKLGGMETWGYHGKVQDEEAFLERYRGSTDAIREIPYNQGYCYTQLTDVMQEINGLLTPERQPKIPLERIREINRDPNS